MNSQGQRFRDFNLRVGTLPPGPLNGITDVTDVRVGHVTLKEDLGEERAIRTGVTAILPHDRDPFDHKLPAAAHVFNGFGKTTGLVQVEELGQLESPIMLTNTFAVAAVTQGTLEWMLEQNAAIGSKAGTVNIVTAECNDAFLNDIRGLHVKPAHARQAIETASAAEVLEGCVGAGTGMSCLGFKGGIGSSSRQVVVGGQTYTVGTLVLANFGRAEELTVCGFPAGRWLAGERSGGQAGQVPGSPVDPNEPDPNAPGDGSIIVVIATDLPALPLLLKRMARRAALGIARTGSTGGHGSGDIFIAFSTANAYDRGASDPVRTVKSLVPDGRVLNTIFQAVVEPVEESVLHALFLAETTRGHQGHVRYQLPVDKVVDKVRSLQEPLS